MAHCESDGKPAEFECIKNKTFEQVVAGVLEYVSKHKLQVQEIGISSFGPIMLDRKDPQYGQLLSIPCEAKATWLGKSLIMELAKALGVPIEKTFLNTDVTGAALGELIHGHHPHKEGSLVYVTVGTGVGVGAVIDGRPIRGKLHPEGGHILVVKDERESLYPHFKGNCKSHPGCLENMITNYAIAERMKVTIDQLPSLPDSEPIWDIVANYLGQLCLTLTYTMSPHVIVIGGGILNRKFILPAVREYFRKYNNDYVKIGYSLDDYIQEAQVPENGIHGAALFKN